MDAAGIFETDITPARPNLYPSAYNRLWHLIDFALHSTKDLSILTYVTDHH